MGAGPAALCIVAELVEQGLAVTALASHTPEQPWPNTYGIWAEELESLGMASLLGQRWTNTVSYFGDGDNEEGLAPIQHHFDYGLFDPAALQDSLLSRCGELSWNVETAVSIKVLGGDTEVLCHSGNAYRARVVIDASGHRSRFIRRPDHGAVAEQAAYGVVGRFSSSPVESGQFVLMDFRPDHLSDEQREKPPSFLYAMDFGEGIFFVEETSLACAPPLSWSELRERLHARLSHRGVEIKEVIHEEYCLFPMNLPLPDRRQPLLAFGGAASMVHPASGYMVGALLRRAPALAKHLAMAMAVEPALDSSALARKGWQVLWSPELVQRHRLYQFGLRRLMSFNEARLRSFFATFFQLPREDWTGFLANTLPLPRLLMVMLRLFLLSSWEIRLGMLFGASST
nr:MULTISPECIES: lycopene cyclase family protein [unclassified Prochlorococcus]